MKNVLVIGSGGREHAMVLSIAKSRDIGNLYACPGNAGISKVASVIKLDLEDFSTISDFCKERKVDLVVIGPEQLLVDGVSDYLRKDGINVFGCSQKSSQLESSKSFTKGICDAKNIKTASYKTCYSEAESLAYLNEQDQYPVVVKADGLAAGKGVVIADDYEEAIIAIQAIFAGKYSSQSRVVIEEYLVGIEASFFALSDGNVVRCFGSAGDHKRIGDGEIGPNTGGMGTYSPSPFIQDEESILQEFIQPTVEYLKESGEVFRGVLFLGLMLTKNGPYLIEYNVRFGDPEIQSILTRLQSDFLDIIYAVSTGKLTDCEIEFSNDKVLTVVLASSGYPNFYSKNTEIKGTERFDRLPDITLYHAGTKIDGDRLLAIGGRVLNVTSKASSFNDAYIKAYDAIKLVDWKEGYYRSDIGFNVINI